MYPFFLSINNAICLTKFCSKFEVDITKIQVPMRFCLGVIPKIATDKLIHFCPNMTSITKYETLRLRPLQ